MGAAAQSTRTPDRNAPASLYARCQLCRSGLRASEGDDLVIGACARCKASRPTQLLAKISPPGGSLDTPKQLVSEFSETDRSMIGRLNGLMPATQLLAMLNDRLEADRPGAPPFTLEQLTSVVDSAGDAPRENDWVTLRKLIADARQCGVLGQITAEVIDDFAIAYQLDRGQVLHLKDVLLDQEED